MTPSSLLHIYDFTIQYTLISVTVEDFPPKNPKTVIVPKRRISHLWRLSYYKVRKRSRQILVEVFLIQKLELRNEWKDDGFEPSPSLSFL